MIHMKKGRVKKIVATLGFVLVFCLCFSFLSNVFIPKYTYEHLADFKRIKNNTLDVVFVGTSRIACGASPMIFWSNTGLRSYNLSTAAQGPQAQFFISQDLLKNHKPKIVFMEADKINENYKVRREHKYIKRAIYQRPFSIDKVKFVWNVYKLDKNQSRLKHFIDYLLPLVNHHRSWKTLDKSNFFSFDSLVEKGQRLDWRVNDITSSKEVDVSETATTDETPDKNTIKYIKKTIELYQKNDVKVVIVTTPQARDTTVASLFIKELVDEYNIEHLNLNSNELLEAANIRTEGDYSDKMHLNSWGSKKMSEFLGQYLKEEYDIYGFDNPAPDDFDFWLNEYETFYWRYNSPMAGKLVNPSSIKDLYAE